MAACWCAGTQGRRLRPLCAEVPCSNSNRAVIVCLAVCGRNYEPAQAGMICRPSDVVSVRDHRTLTTCSLHSAGRAPARERASRCTSKITRSRVFRRLSTEAGFRRRLPHSLRLEIRAFTGVDMAANAASGCHPLYPCFASCKDVLLEDVLSKMLP